MTARRTAIYTRISADQTGERLGVTRQLDDCVGLADRLGWEVTAHYDDNDLSAFNGKHRPGFEALLDAMKTGQVDALICWHTDRLYRSLKDLARLIEVAMAARVQIRTVNSGDLDLSTSTGRMLATILAGVAVQEAEHKGERQRAANAQKAVAGKWQTANRCFGYTMTGEPLEPEATAFRTAVADVLAGKSIRAVATEWNAKGVKTTLAGTTQKQHGKEHLVTGTWNSPRVRRLLVNPRYAGLKVHRDKVIGKGDWTALIDEDTHSGLLAYLSDPSRIKCTSFERKYIGSGVYECGRCGGKMKSALPGGRKNYVYVCRDHAHMLRSGQPLDEYVTDTLLWRLGQPDAHLLLDTQRIDIPALQAEREVLQARLDTLADQFADGAINDSQLRRGTSTLRTKLAPIDTQLAQAARIDPVAGLLTAAEGDPVKLQDCWDATTPAVRGQIIDQLMVVTVNAVGKGGARGFDPRYIEIDWRRP